MPEKVPSNVKKQVEERAKGCCEYCMAQVRYSQDYFSVEHIIPLVGGGTHSMDNLAFSCQACNSHKYISTEAIDSISGEMVPLFNPRNDSWKAHFRWDENFTNIIGVTSIGRATVLKLKLNREGLVNLREVLRTAKKHPPLQSI